MRDGDWKLIVNKKTDRAELFNLAADPCEKDDLAARHPERVAALRKLMAKLSARDNDAKVKEGSTAMIFPDEDNYPMNGFGEPQLVFKQ